MTEPTPAEALKAGWHDERQTRAEIVDEAIEGLRADLRSIPTPDAGEVRTYREGVEDAARLAETCMGAPDSIPPIGYGQACIDIAAAIRKLP